MNNDYRQGGDVLFKFKDGESKLAVGHCSTHTLTLNAETKARSVKAAANQPSADGLFDEKSVNKMSASLSAEGYVYDGESEMGYKKLLAAYKAHIPVEGGCFIRGASDPYCTANWIITSLEMSAPAGDDATFSLQAESTGKVEIDETKFVEPAEPQD